MKIDLDRCHPVSYENQGLSFIKPVVDHPWIFIVLSIAITSFLGFGMSRMGFTNDYRVYFSKDNPQLVAFESLQDTYTKSDNLLIVVAPKQGEIFTARNLKMMGLITERAWQTPYSTRVDSITNFQHTVAKGDDLIVRDLVPNANLLNQEEIAEIKKIALAEPLLIDRLISPGGRVSAVNITIQLPRKRLTEINEVASFARQLSTSLSKTYPDVDFYLTGIAMMNSNFSEAATDDLQTLVPAMFVFIVLTMMVLLGSVTATVATVTVIVFSVVVAMGTVGWLNWNLSPTSSIAPTIIMTIAIADCVHILVTALHNMKQGLDQKSAVMDSLRVNFRPIMITSITTAVGFASMNFSDAPPFRNLGTIVALGVLAAFFFSVTILPAAMVVVPIRVKNKFNRLNERMESIANFVIRRRTILFWSCGISAIVLISQLTMNELNDEFVKYFDKSVDFRVATDFANDNLTGIYTIEYSLHSGSSGGISEPSFLTQIENFSSWLKAQPEVVHVNTITDIYKRLNKNMHGDDDHYYGLPETRELSAQYLLLYEMSLPYGLDLNNQINVDKSATRLIVTLKNMSSNRLLALESKFANWLNKNAANIQSQTASPTLMFSHIGERNIKSMLVGTIIALVLISLILIFALRSVKFGLISMIPNLVPAAMAFGVWGLVSGQVGLSLSIVIGMTLGIVVDDTVHFLNKFLISKREHGLHSQDAVRHAFSSVGTALLITSFTLVCGFLVLSFSPFRQNGEMGLMTAITISIALIMDFLFLPPLLMKMERDSPARDQSFEHSRLTT